MVRSFRTIFLVRMPLKLVIVSLLLTATLTLADTDAEVSQKILGTWSERNHEVTFLPNGKWKLAKFGDVSPGVFRWHIKNGNLVLFRNGTTFPPEKIVWVMPDQFFLQDGNGGQSAPYYRHIHN